MSRVGKAPIKVPDSVKINFTEPNLQISGPLGELRLDIPQEIKMVIDSDPKIISFAIEDKFCKRARAFWGLYRVLVNNMVVGTTVGFTKELVISGVGYKAEMCGPFLRLSLGKSHDTFYQVPAGITIQVPKPTEIVIKGIDKQRVGQVAAEIKKLKKVEPYKLKGIYEKGAKLVKKEVKKS